MKTVTIDASCATSWLFAEQRTLAADRLLLDGEIYRTAPDIFVWELGNFISLRAGQGRVDPAVLRGKLDQLDVRLGAPRDRDATLALIPPAVFHRLNLFDTAYLLHALGHGGALASRNGPLLEAAMAASVDVFDLRD
ncbi:MAG: type II toxin-antitoxin system VapC family toxin [Brevundimonas sp.]|nr:type II toxin-antitoxin system VapC family toxin [Brevundimonas sp.]